MSTSSSTSSSTTSPTAAADIRPITIEPDELARWSKPGSWQHRLGRFWVKYVPRGKGRIPQLIGRHLCGPDTRDVIRTAAGATLAIDCSSLDTYCAIEHTGGAWDRHVLDICARLLKPGSVFYDIGANVGSISIETAKRFDDQVHVYAFEPQPSLARAIAISAALNSFKNLQVFSLMLGKSDGQGDLFMAHHSIHASSIPREQGAAAIHCPMVKLDTLIAAGTVAPPSVIKIDVEGGEWDVFHGAANTISTHRPPIIFECDVNAARFGYTRQQLCDYLHELAEYRFYAIRDDQLQPAEALMNDDTVADLAAIPPGVEIR